MARYTYSAVNQTLSTTTGLFTIEAQAIASAGAVCNMQEFLLGGESGSSNVARLAFNRPSSVPTGAGTYQTAEKLNTASATANHKVATSYASTQGVLSTNDVLAWSFNTFGGWVRWNAMPGEEVYVIGGASASYLIIRSRSGTPVVTGHLVVEEN